MKYDIVIIGGGIIGSSAAWFLANDDRAGRVAVIEPDPSYEFATTPQGAGGIRQLFSRPENIAMSQFSLDFYKNFATNLANGDEAFDIGFQNHGYLFAVGPDGVDDLQKNYETQTSMGAPVEILDRDAVLAKFPSIQRADIVLGCYSGEDGWVDPNAALQGFKRAAEQLGVDYIKARVTDIATDDTRAKSVMLDTGETVDADVFINAAGPSVAEVANMTGADLPVRPMCRVQHYWKCAHEIEAMPLVKVESGMFVRPEGEGFVGGCPSFDIEPGFVEDISYGFFSNYFEDTVWPMIAELIPKFEEVKLQRSWAGHYAQNLLDGNMIIGSYSKDHPNLLTACGFSGHGLMHAPAVGRALSELALDQRFQTLDLSNLGIQRVWDNQPYRETGIK